MREVEVVDGNATPVRSLSLFIARDSCEGGGEGEEAGKQPRTYPRLFVRVSNRHLRPPPSPFPPPPCEHNRGSQRSGGSRNGSRRSQSRPPETAQSSEVVPAVFGGNARQRGCDVLELCPMLLRQVRAEVCIRTSMPTAMCPSGPHPTFQGAVLSRQLYCSERLRGSVTQGSPIRPDSGQRWCVLQALCRDPFQLLLPFPSRVIRLLSRHARETRELALLPGPRHHRAS